MCRKYAAFPVELAILLCMHCSTHKLHVLHALVVVEPQDSIDMHNFHYSNLIVAIIQFPGQRSTMGISLTGT